MMKILSERAALERLDSIVSNFRSKISDYERRAKNCLTCETPGACCKDAHFVNVRITRLEAVAIGNALRRIPADRSNAVKERIEDAISRYDLSDDGEAPSQMFACPLFEKGIGCLVHSDAKPSPCIAHACYEDKTHLPPGHLLAHQEAKIERLNERTYRRYQPPLPLPIALKRVLG